MHGIQNNAQIKGRKLSPGLVLLDFGQMHLLSGLFAGEEEISFVTLSPGANVMKHFLSVIYGFL